MGGARSVMAVLMACIVFHCVVGNGVAADKTKENAKALIGRWELDESTYVRFHADGTYSSSLHPLHTWKDGKWKVISEKVVQLEIPSIGFTVKPEIKYILKGEQLVLEGGGMKATTLKRVDKGK